MSVPYERRELLPAGTRAMINSENHQPTAVMGYGPWRLSDCRNLPLDMKIAHIEGQQPEDRLTDPRMPGV